MDIKNTPAQSLKKALSKVAAKTGSKRKDNGSPYLSQIEEELAPIFEAYLYALDTADYRKNPDHAFRFFLYISDNPDFAEIGVYHGPVIEKEYDLRFRLDETGYSDMTEPDATGLTIKEARAKIDAQLKTMPPEFQQDFKDHIETDGEIADQPLPPPAKQSFWARLGFKA